MAEGEIWPARMNAQWEEVICGLERALAGSCEEDLLEYLKKLETFSVTFEMLAASNIARTVGKLRRHQNQNISSVACGLVDKWKSLEESATTSRALPDLREYLLSTIPPEENNKAYDSSANISHDRYKLHHRGDIASGPVVYLVQRDLRVSDNWALLLAQNLATTHNSPLIILYRVTESLTHGSMRHSGFALRCLKQMQATATAFHIPLLLLEHDNIITFCEQHNISAIITDFNPLREHRQVLDTLATSLPRVTIGVVDTHNIIPCWKVSDKCEFAAKTIRPKVHRLIETYLTSYCPVKSQSHLMDGEHGSKLQLLLEESETQWSTIETMLHLNSDIPETAYPTTEIGAYQSLLDFLHHGLDQFSAYRNDPTKDATSNLSPFLHFGLLSSQRILLTIQQLKQYKTPSALFGSSTTNNSTSKSSVYAFCEELVVRKELSDNFCFYNPKYDSLSGAHR